jgi:Leucine-rich repeat (LRR) protein
MADDAAEQAYAAAVEEIARVKEAGEDVVIFVDRRFSALEIIPSTIKAIRSLKGLSLRGTQIGDLAPLTSRKNLRSLHLAYTKVSDLAPLVGLKNLRLLWLNSTNVNDLRPLINLDQPAGKTLNHLDFRNTPATARDGRLAELAEIKNDEERTRKTLEYLRSLPP